MKHIFVIARNGGCEGYSSPVQAFNTYEEALAGKMLSGYDMNIFKVPIWPEPTQDWYAISEYIE